MPRRYLSGSWDAILCVAGATTSRDRLGAASGWPAIHHEVPSSNPHRIPANEVLQVHQRLAVFPVLELGGVEELAAFLWGELEQSTIAVSLAFELGTVAGRQDR